MPQQTGYHSWTRPVPHEISTEDENDWAGILEQWCEDEVEEAVIKRGTLSERDPPGSSTNPDEPRLYLATDQTPPLLSIDNDTEWVALNPFDDSVLEATKIFGGSIVNGGHSDFGTAQDAINFADTNNYQEVRFPPGIYGAIAVPAGVAVTGGNASNLASGRRVRFQFSGGGPTVDLAGRADIKHCAVENTGTGAGDYAIQANFRSRVTNVSIVAAGDHGITTNDGNQVLITHCHASDGSISGNSAQITTNSGDCIVSHNTNFGSIGNNGGSTNTVVNNT